MEDGVGKRNLNPLRARAPPLLSRTKSLFVFVPPNHWARPSTHFSLPAFTRAGAGAVFAAGEGFTAGAAEGVAAATCAVALGTGVFFPPRKKAPPAPRRTTAAAMLPQRMSGL